MKKIFRFVLLGALLLGTTACKKDKASEGSSSGTMLINGRTETVRNVFYSEEPADEETGKTVGVLILGPEGAPGSVEPEFHISFEISESLLGETLDLTRPLKGTTWPLPYLDLSARNGTIRITVDYDEDPAAQGVSGGSLRMTREGDRFDIALSITCTNGNRAEVTWTGQATKISGL